MTQTLWHKVIAEAEKKMTVPSLFDFRLFLSRIVLYTVISVFIFIEIIVILEGHEINFIPVCIALTLSIAGLIYLYSNPKKSAFLFYLLPVYCLVVGKIWGYDLMKLYGEVFVPYYFVLIVLNYLLCSSKIAFIYSALIILTIFMFYGGSDSAHQVFGRYYMAYFIFIIAETVIGYVMSLRYETKTKIDEILQTIDSHTGLLNNIGFTRSIKSAVTTESSFYLILIDIDNFNEISDNVESIKMDEILKDIATKFMSIPDGFDYSRFNFDKFAFLSHAQNSLILTEQLERFAVILKAISAKYSLENAISFSSGIVFYPEQASDVSQLLSFAEIALEKSKSHKSKTRNTFFIREYLDDKNRINAIQKDLLSACRNGELQVFYQPKISLVDKTVTGMEALSRWTHPNIGYVSPEEFVKIAERNGHILSFGEYVLESALRHIRIIHDLGLTNVTISINVSPLQLLQKGFCENVLAKAQDIGVEPSKIYLEITEGTMLKKESAAILKCLKNMGFNLSLDDFGTGYSSLNYLHQYSFDELKIDKSFTDGLMRGRNERRLFKFLITLARELGMKAVTEGVEDDVQIRLLKGLGAEEIQGWYYSKALSSLDCIEYIKNFRFNEASLGSIDLTQTNEFFINKNSENKKNE